MDLIRKGLTTLFFAIGALTNAPALPHARFDAVTRDGQVVPRSVRQGSRNRTRQFARTELLFGTAKPDGAVSEEEFGAFLDEVVTPRFPQGLTVGRAQGRFTGQDGILVKEDSYLLVLLYPLETATESHQRIEVIRRLYESRFQQESVLRVDDPFTVRVSW
jgi:hypothetical protein